MLDDGSVDVELRDEVIRLYDELTGANTTDLKQKEAIVILIRKWLYVIKFLIWTMSYIKGKLFKIYFYSWTIKTMFPHDDTLAVGPLTVRHM